METMDQKICLDSDIIIDFLNRKEETYEKIKSYDAHFVTTSVNVFEVWIGRKENEIVKEFFDTVDILPFDSNASILAADIMRELKRTGKILDFRDIFIAAICINNRLSLLTNNKSDFSRLTKFGLLVLE